MPEVATPTRASILSRATRAVTTTARAWGVFAFAVAASLVQAPQVYRGLLAQVGTAPPAESLENLLLLRAAGGSLVITLSLGYLAHEIAWTWARRAPYRRLLLTVWVAALVVYAAFAYETAPVEERLSTLILTVLVELLVSAVAVAHVARELHADALADEVPRADEDASAELPEARAEVARERRRETLRGPEGQPGDTNFSCSTCGKNFAKQQGLAAHIGNNPGHIALRKETT